MRQRVLIHQYLMPGAVLALASTTFLLHGPIEALPVLLAGSLAFLSSRRLLDLVAEAEAETCYLDDQLIQSQKLASIGELSSGVAHEINNPLAIIGQETEWIAHLLRDAKWDEHPEMSEVRDSVRAIEQQVDRCRDITHKLLNFARKMEPVLQDANVNRLVDDMLALVEQEAKLADIALERSFDPGIPVIQTDPPLLRQVILNLLVNAMQAIQGKGDGTVHSVASAGSEKPGECGRINVSTRETAGFVRIIVQDSGPGIPPEIRQKIFDPFFTTKPAGQGTGLGLSLCHGIVVRLGGRIEVESEPGRGAAFSVWLPKSQGA